MIFIKGYYCISRDPFIASKEEIWLDGSMIKHVEIITGVGDGYALAVVRYTGATFAVATFHSHKYRKCNYDEAEEAKSELEKLLKGNYRPETDCGFEYHIVGD